MLSGDHRPVPDFGIAGPGLAFFTTPVIEGEPLDRLLMRLEGDGTFPAGPVPLRRLVGSVRDACRAVEHARERGVVNRDLIPDFILVGDDFRDVVVNEGWERIRGENVPVGRFSGCASGARRRFARRWRFG
jgi:hypothetical protein